MGTGETSRTGLGVRVWSLREKSEPEKGEKVTGESEELCSSGEDRLGGSERTLVPNVWGPTLLNSGVTLSKLPDISESVFSFVIWP